MPSSKFTKFPTVLPCGAVSINCTVSGVIPEDGVAEKFNAFCVVPPEPPIWPHEREKYARESGPKIPLPIPPNVVTFPFACHRATAERVNGQKYPVGLTLKYPCALRYACSAVTSLSLTPVESERPNAGHTGTATTMGLETTLKDTVSNALATAEKAINEVATSAVIEPMSKSF